MSRRLGFPLDRIAGTPGFPLPAGSIETDLPKAVSILPEHDVHILNVTVSLPNDDERLYAACAAAGVGMNRVMLRPRRPELLGRREAARARAGLPPCRYAKTTMCRLACRTTTATPWGPTQSDCGTWSRTTTHTCGRGLGCGPLRVGRHGAGAGAGGGRVPSLCREPEECLLAAGQRAGSGNRRVAGLLHFRCAGRSSWKRVADKLKAMAYDGSPLFLGRVHE